MFCGDCGKRIPDDSNVCIYCGAKISENSAPTPAPNQKACPKCQSFCFADEFFCTNCGYTFGFQPTQNESSAKSVVDKPVGVTIIFRIFAILTYAFIIFTFIFDIFDLINLYRYGFNTTDLVCRSLGIIVSAFLVAVGLIAGNNNPIPGIGYLMFVITGIVSVIIFASTLSVSDIIMYVAEILMASMFFVKIEFIKKLWFVPAILMLIAYIIIYFPDFDSLVYMSYAVAAFCTGFVAKQCWET